MSEYVHLPTQDEMGEDLIMAASRGYVERSAQLLERGVNVNRTDFTGMTALHWASHHGYEQVVQLLLSAGADVAAKDDSGRQPLAWAVMKNHVDVCRMLLEAGADAGHANSRWTVALHTAVINGCMEIVRLLVQHGASSSFVPIHPSPYYMTPFQEAIQCNKIDVARFLAMECGEDMAQRTEDGKTLIKLAGSNRELKALLRSIKTDQVIREAAGEDAPSHSPPSRRPGGAGPL